MTVIRAGAPADLAGVRVGLVEAFERTQQAIADGHEVVVVVEAGDLLGHHGPTRGAYVGALVGMARAVAFEGAKPGWSMNVVALPAGREVDDEQAAAQVRGLTGQVVTLGAGLVGKVGP